MPKIVIPTALRQYAGNTAAVEVQGATAGEVLASLTTQFPDLKKHLYDANGKLRSFVNVFVNDDDIRSLQNENTPVKDTDDISIIPAIAGGAGTEARTASSLPDLTKDEIARYSRHLIMPEVGMEMPVSWKQVQDQLAAITDQPFIPMQQYQHICSAEGLSAGSATTVLRFLHHSGFLFWHEQYLQDQIILDQKWALDAIYQLLDRNSWYKILKGNGLRKRSDLALAAAELIDLARLESEAGEVREPEFVLLTAMSLR